MRAARSDRYTIQTLRRGLHVLETLETADGDLSLTELADRLGESQTVVFRMLRTLEEAGYVHRDAATKRYRLGLRVWELGCRAVNRMGLVEVARPVLRRLAGETGETSYLGLVRGIETIYVDVVEGGEPLRVYAEPGMRVPLFLTASGKAILAHRGPDLFEAVVAAGMPRQTPHTVSTASRLRERLEAIRRTGVSVNLEERRPDICAAASPIFDRTGECVAAVGVSGPSLRFRGERLDETVRAVRAAAAEVSATLGFQPPGGARRRR